MAGATAAPKILVADDDPVVLEVVERALKGAGFEVYPAGGGVQALEIAAATGIDLALLDYRMPGLSGLEVGKSIHEMTATRFIVMSAHSDRELIDKAAGEGALGFIVKPLNLSELVAQMRVGVERAHEIKSLKSTIEGLEKGTKDAIARAVASARSVNTALGILMERLRLPRDAVYGQLVQRTRNERRRLVDLCEEIIRAREHDYAAPPKGRE